MGNFCTKCGTKVSENEQFCHSCGTKLNVSGNQSVELSKNHEDQNNQSSWNVQPNRSLFSKEYINEIFLNKE